MRNFRYNPDDFVDPRFGRRPGTAPRVLADEVGPEDDPEARAYLARYRFDPAFQAMLGTVADIKGLWPAGKPKTIYRWAGDLTRRLPHERDRVEVVQDGVLRWMVKLKWLKDRHPLSVGPAQHLESLTLAVKDAITDYNARVNRQRLWGKQMVVRETEKGTTEDPLEQALPSRHHVDATRLASDAFFALYEKDPLAQRILGMNVGFQEFSGVHTRGTGHTPHEISRLLNIPFAQVQAKLSSGRDFILRFIENEMKNSPLGLVQLGEGRQNPRTSWLRRLWVSLFG